MPVTRAGRPRPITADAWIKPWLGQHLTWVRWVLPAFCAVGVIAVGKVPARRQAMRAPEAEPKEPTLARHR